MRLLIFVLLVFVGFSALAIKVLPLWLSIPLVVIIGVPLVWLIWKITRFIKKVKEEFSDFIPKEKVQKIGANETFRGHGFSFTFPVASEVSQIQIQDFEALMIKPRFDFPDAPKDTLLVASTFTRAELKEKIDETIEKIFARIEDSQLSDPVPATVGDLTGERQSFAATKDGKSVKGEAVYLDIKGGSIVWVALGPEAIFEKLTARYQELALLIKRAQADTTVDVQAEVSG